MLIRTKFITFLIPWDIKDLLLGTFPANNAFFSEKCIVVFPIPAASFQKVEALEVLLCHRTKSIVDCIRGGQLIRAKQVFSSRNVHLSVTFRCSAGSSSY